ncbi:MAG: universal stress protein [Pseudomonadota bacterium]
MSYKTILVHADLSRHAKQRIKIAADLAISENAHLIGAAMTGISRFVCKDGKLDPAYAMVSAHIEELKVRASQALSEFEAIASQMGVLSFEARLVNDEPEGGLALQARYCDLAVLGQTDPDEASPGLVSDLPEYVMLNCARPVLLIPHSGQIERLGNKVLVAWDGSIEASRAIANALPLLQRAKNVTVAVFNATAHSEVHGAQPGADIALYLARHGIKVEVVQKHIDFDIGSGLRLLAADTRSDLIVMGGYGHTRFREVLLGGVTLTMLRSMTIPVLMSH